MVIKKILHVIGLVTMTVPNTKIKKVDKKIPDLKFLIRKTNYDAKM